MTYVVCMGNLSSMSAAVHSSQRKRKRESTAKTKTPELLTKNHRLIVLHCRKCIVQHDNNTRTPTHTHTTLFKHSPLAQHETNARKMNLLLRFLLLPYLFFFFLLLLLLLKSMQKAFKPCCLCLGAVMWQQQPQKLSAQKD